MVQNMSNQPLISNAHLTTQDLSVVEETQLVYDHFLSKSSCTQYKTYEYSIGCPVSEERIDTDLSPYFQI